MKYNPKNMRYATNEGVETAEQYREWRDIELNAWKTEKAHLVKEAVQESYRKFEQECRKFVDESVTYSIEFTSDAYIGENCVFWNLSIKGKKVVDGVEKIFYNSPNASVFVNIDYTDEAILNDIRRNYAKSGYNDMYNRIKYRKAQIRKQKVEG